MRRLAARFVRICERWQEESPAIHALARDTLETVRRYMELHDALAIRRTDRKIELGEERRAADALARSVSVWATVVARHRPLDPEVYRAATGVTDDVISGAERLLHLVGEEGPLHDHPIAADVLNAVTPLLESTRKESQEAHAMARETQAMERSVRELSLEVQDALKRLRPLLRAHVGASHVDYRSLRAKHRRGDVDVDDVADMADVAGVADVADVADAADEESAPLDSSVTSDVPESDVA
jgi:hypothetical protein